MGDRKHEREIQYYEGEIEELARLIARLAYDQTGRFVGAFAEELERQSEADSDRDRPKLSKNLGNAARALEEARRLLGKAWEISAPHMSPEELGEDDDDKRG